MIDLHLREVAFCSPEIEPIQGSIVRPREWPRVSTAGDNTEPLERWGWRTHFDLSSGLSCLPGVGVFVSVVNMLSHARERVKAVNELSRIIAFQMSYSYVDAYGADAKKRAISILEKGQLDAICGVIGNGSTAAASLVLFKRGPAIWIVVSCILLTLAQGRRLAQNANILSKLRSSQ